MQEDKRRYKPLQHEACGEHYSPSHKETERTLPYPNSPQEETDKDARMRPLTEEVEASPVKLITWNNNKIN
jgi:hypothetical protein